MNKTKEQLKAIEKLERLKVGALFMSMGTGKTRVALELIASRIKKVNYILWICPYSLKAEIEKERLKWHPELEFDVVGCESIGQSDRIYLELTEKLEKAEGNSFIVVDESLKIKNLSAKRTRRILALGRNSKYRLILNGTPVSRNILDIYTQMEFLSPTILNMSMMQFKDTYCEYYTRGKLKGKVRCESNIENLISKINPYIFESELDLRQKRHYETVRYSVDSYAYEEKKEELFLKYYDSEEDDINFYAFSVALQKFYTQSPDRAKVLNSLIDKIDGKVIVYVKFLQSIPNGAVAITGDVKEEERSKILKRFEGGEFQILYITYGCGSFGLNLQFCHNTIFLDLTWDYAQNEQAEARTYRTGQTEDVNYYYVKCANSGLEKMISESVDKKADLLDTMKHEIERQGVKEWVKSL